jgi:NADPH-dependent ferric siderophore reductase
MLRVTLGGVEMASFPQDQESAYVKLIFPDPVDGHSLTRTYTVSEQRQNEIDVDFALHAGEGVASNWAMRAEPGNRIRVGGPGPRKLINMDADWFLLAGDMTALPAINVNLGLLPRDARGYVVLEVIDESDIQPVKPPPGIEVHWVVCPSADISGSTLLNRIEQLTWLPGQPAVWAACEFHSMRALRKYLRLQCQWPKGYLYVSSYWKIGCTEDQHKIEKQDDAQSAQS